LFDAASHRASPHSSQPVVSDLPDPSVMFCDGTFCPLRFHWTDDVKETLQDQKAVETGSRHVCRARQETEICLQIVRSGGQQEGVAVCPGENQVNIGHQIDLNSYKS
jgi:hypothetical protein